MLIPNEVRCLLLPEDARAFESFYLWRTEAGKL